MIEMTEEEWENIIINQGYFISDIEESIIDNYFRNQEENKPINIPHCYE